MSAPNPPLPATNAVPDVMLSFRHRDPLAEALTRLGRTVIAARRANTIGQRFIALGAHVLIVDARDAGIEALQAVEANAALVAGRGMGLIVIVGEAEADLAPALIAAGAHQLVGAPWRDWELVAALLSADTHRMSAAMPPTALLGAWQADLLSGSLSFDPDSDPALVASFGGSGTLRQALAHVDAEARRDGFSALRRLRAGASHAAAVQRVAGQRWVHHLSGRASMLAGHVEHLGTQGAAHMRDGQTGLGSLTAAQMAIAARQAAGQSVPIGIAEIARLSVINDSAGRNAGDMLIARVARALERHMHDQLGSETMVARLSGARFLVVAPPDIGMSRLSLDLRAAAAAITEGALPVTGAVPVALRVATGSLTSDMGHAGIAAVASRLATPRALVRSVDIEALLAGDQLRILFQPQYAMAEDRLVGAEVLVRWQHPKLGEVSGSVLFAAAKASGFERQLSMAAWDGALRMMARWPQSMVALRVGLNATAADLADPLMPGALLTLAADHGIDPARLTIEVTEADVIDRLDDAAAALRRLRAAGMKVALDDFGTGYSGLSWLKRLPADLIKIDAGFARDALGAPRDRAVLAGVIGLARMLDLGVLAEGVETTEQRDLLAAAGCSAWQGHLRSPAITDAEFVRLASEAC